VVTESLRLLVAISGAEDPALAGFVGRVVASGDGAIELTLLHVVDDDARALAGGFPMRRTPWPAPSKGATERRLEQADEAGATALLESWRVRFAGVLPPGAKIDPVVRSGRPEREIVAAAIELHVDSIVVCARPGPGAAEPGPRSVGHVARFLLDHSPVPVLLVRGLLRGPGGA
jgi:nucleotide-binding universal stress UspA family protein